MDLDIQAFVTVLVWNRLYLSICNNAGMEQVT